jgi:hypothetical protein
MRELRAGDGKCDCGSEGIRPAADDDKGEDDRNADGGDGHPLLQHSGLAV